MKRKYIKWILIGVLIAIVAIPYFLYNSLDVYEWKGAYIVNEKTGIKYLPCTDPDKAEELYNLDIVKTIGRIKGDSILWKSWIQKIEGVDEQRYIHLHGFMYDAVYESAEYKGIPKDFGFTLKYGVGAKNVIDTFKGIFEKDLVSAGTAKANLNFTSEELKQIYEKMQAIDILSYPANYLPPYSDNPMPGITQMVTPYMTYHLYITIDGSVKEINWADTNGSEAVKAKELRALFNYIDELIKNKEAYKKLPEAVGGYD